MAVGPCIEEEFDRPLLERFRPQLRCDAQEPYRAMAAESICDNSGNLLVREDGTVIAEGGGEGEAALSIALLSAYPDELGPAPGDRLDETGDILAAARRMQGDETYANRVYGRVVRCRDRRWLQYWFWLYYNPKHLLGFGRHEGDWEMIQLGLREDDEPELVTYAQHDRGERKRFEQLEPHRENDGVHPIVYVAPFSHASYFEAGTHFYLGGTDNPDGRVVMPLPALEEFGEWGSWEGRWGNSRGVLWPWSPGKLGGRSPASPGKQEPKWSNPQGFHDQAQERPPRESRLAWKLGKATYPKEPRITGVRAEEQRVTVEYEIERGGLRRPDQLLVTVHDAAEPGEPVLRSQAIPVSPGRGAVEILLPDPVAHPLVRASTFNRLRQPATWCRFRRRSRSSNSGGLPSGPTPSHRVEPYAVGTTRRQGPAVRHRSPRARRAVDRVRLRPSHRLSRSARPRAFP